MECPNSISSTLMSLLSFVSRVVCHSSFKSYAQDLLEVSSVFKNEVS